MAGVRSGGSITPICEPKGLPSDLSKVVALSFSKWEGDAHTISWFNSYEIREAVNYHLQIMCEVPDHIPSEQSEKYIREKANVSMEKTGRELYKARDEVFSQWGYLFGNHLYDFNTHRDDFPEEIEDIRLVFWFDN